MDWQSDAARREAGRRHRQGAEGRRARCISPPTRIARARRSPGTCKAMLADKKALKGVKVRRITFNEITRNAVRYAMAASARPRPAADRGLPGAPRARLPGGLHAVAGAVAQAARQPLRRARAVGRAAADLRPRGRDRGVPRPRILDGGGRLHHAGRRAVHRAADASRRQEARAVRPAQRSDRRCAPRPRSRPAASPSARSRRSASSAIRRRRSPPRRCSRRRRASSASARSRPCAWRSSCTKASTSAARPPA